MPYQSPKTRILTVTSVSEMNRTRNGNAFVECDTNEGVIAVWGKTDMRNITAVLNTGVPFDMECGLISSNWPQHRFWIPESARIEIVLDNAGPSRISIPSVYEAAHSCSKEATLGPDELNKCRRRMLRLLDRLFGPSDPEDGLISRIVSHKRDGRIPRKIAALMITVAEIRNATEHANEALTSNERNAARFSWEAVSDWASHQGVDVNTL